MSTAIANVVCECGRHHLIKLEIKKRKINVERKLYPFNEYMEWALRELYGMSDKEEISAGYRRYGRAVKDILAFCRGDIEKAKGGTKSIGLWLQKRNLDWTLDTVAKWMPEWNASPERFNAKN